MLLYVQGAFALLSLLGLGLGGSAYIFLAFLVQGGSRTLTSFSTLATFSILVSGLAYVFAALAIVNGRRLGWKLGLGLSVGAVILPLAVGGIGLVLGSTYVISYLFDIALVVALAHPQSREYQKVWLD